MINNYSDLFFGICIGIVITCFGICLFWLYNLMSSFKIDRKIREHEIEFHKEELEKRDLEEYSKFVQFNEKNKEKLEKIVKKEID